MGTRLGQASGGANAMKKGWLCGANFIGAKPGQIKLETSSNGKKDACLLVITVFYFISSRLGGIVRLTLKYRSQRMGALRWRRLPGCAAAPALAGGA